MNLVDSASHPIPVEHKSGARVRICLAIQDAFVLGPFGAVEWAVSSFPVDHGMARFSAR